MATISFEKLPNEIIDLIISKVTLVSDVLTLRLVSRRLYHLANFRLSHVNYLISKSPNGVGGRITKRNALSYQLTDRTQLMASVKNLPSLKVLEIHEACGPNAHVLRDIFSCKPNVLGVWFNYPFPSRQNPVPVSTAIISSTKFDSGTNDFRQLFIETVCKELWAVIPQITNLKRLHIEYYRAESLVDYHGMPFFDIEMLEIAVLGIINYYNQHYMILVDKCPSLKSLFLSFVHCKEFQTLFHSLNHNLVNLVLEYEDESIQSWSSLGPFLHKYPNLKFLAIRGNPGLNDYHIRQLIHYWRHLELIDVRGCNITQNSIDYVYRFNTKRPHLKPIKFISGPLPKSYHSRRNYRAKCEGIDFMGNIFFKSFGNIPLFLKPIPKSQTETEST